MPELQGLKYIPELHLPSEPLKLDNDPVSVEYAFSIVKQTFFQFEAHRRENFDNKFISADQLYDGYLPQRFWDAQKTVPRSSLPVNISFDQVETVAAQMEQALWGGGTDEYFQVEAGLMTTPQQARDVEDQLRYNLECDPKSFGITARNEMSLAIREQLKYGNGGVFLDYDPARNRPIVSWVSILDLYTDPGCAVPWIDGCSAVIRRKPMSVSELAELRGAPDMDIPNNDYLYTLAEQSPHANADRTKQVIESTRGVNFVPGVSDRSPVPSEHTVEVLIYYSASRIIWVLGRNWVAYNKPNPYGFIPAAYAPGFLIPGRFYGKGLPEVLRSNQRTMEGLLNGHLDEVHLALENPRAIKRDPMNTTLQRTHPGQAWVVENPKEDIIFYPPSGMTTNVFQELGYISSLAKERTGVNFSASGGTPTPSNANRTLGGMQMQAGGGNTRIAGFVKNFEDFLLTPLLYKMHRMMLAHNTWGDVSLPAKPKDPRDPQRLVNADVYRQEVHFKMIASSRLISRQAIANNIPIIVQYMTAGPLVGGLQQIGKTVDFEQILDMLQYGTGTNRRWQLVRDLTPQEQQAAQQRQQQEMAAQQQAQQQQMQMEMMKIQADVNPQKLEFERQMGQMKFEFEKAMGEMKLAIKQQELEITRQKNEMEMQREAMTSAYKARATESELAMDNMRFQQEIQHKMTSSEVEIEAAKKKAAAIPAKPKAAK